MAVSYTLNGVNYTTSGTAANPVGYVPPGATNISYLSVATPATPQELQAIQNAATTPRYDTKTGLLTDYGKSLGLKETGLITSNALQNVQPIPLPPQTPKTGYTSSNAGLGILNPDGTFVIQPPEQPKTKTASEYMQEVMATIPKPQRLSEGYSQLEQQSGLQQAKQQEASTQSAINVILARANADILSARNQSSSEGGTAGILSAREDAINRSASIKLLPLQAQLATDQKNVELAQTHLDTLFKIYAEDVKASNDYYYKVGEIVRGYMDKQEQRQYDTIVAQKKRQDDVADSELKFQKDLALKAIESGQGGLAGRIMAIQHPVFPASNDEYSVDKYNKEMVQYNADIAKVSGQIANTVSSSISTQVVDVNGKKLLINSKTGETIKEIGGNGVASTNDLQLAQTQANIQEISDILKSGGMGASVGTSFITRQPIGFWGNLGATASLVGIPSVLGGAYKNLTGEKQNFIASVEQVRSALNLDTLIKAKQNGATFGALSNQELQVLANTATKIGSWAIQKNGKTVGYNATEKDFKAELDKINNFAKLDYLLKGGVPESIGAVIQPDNTIWVQNSDGTYTKLR